MCCSDGAMPGKADRRRTFPKAARLTRASEFDLVRHRGQSITGKHFILGYLRTDESSPSRIGIITSKRLGNAVVRNKVRRWFREIARISRLQKGFWLVLVARKAAVSSSLLRIQEEWMRIGKRCTIFES